MAKPSLFAQVRSAVQRQLQRGGAGRANAPRSPAALRATASMRWGPTMEKKSHLDSYTLFLNICKGLVVVTALVLLGLLLLVL